MVTLQILVLSFLVRVRVSQRQKALLRKRFFVLLRSAFFLLQGDLLCGELSGRPTQKGVYILDGRKTVINDHQKEIPYPLCG